MTKTADKAVSLHVSSAYEIEVTAPLKIVLFCSQFMERPTKKKKGIRPVTSQEVCKRSGGSEKL